MVLGLERGVGGILFERGTVLMVGCFDVDDFWSFIPRRDVFG